MIGSLDMRVHSPILFRILSASILLLTIVAPEVWAARISEINEASVTEQAWRFFTFQDPSLRYALFGSLLMGLSCGLLGSFLVVRKLSLMGDCLSHAVLPGVMLGFLWNMTKDPWALLIGATLAGLFGTMVVSWITHTTRLKEDAALGIVLASFFAVGIVLLTMIQSLPTASKSGLDKMLFGQAAALGADDIAVMSVVAGITCTLLLLLYKELLASSFDPGFARVSGLPVRLLHHGLMLFLAFSIVISLQAVGVVLVSAMLITPAAAAYLLTDRFNRMLLLAAGFGMLSGAVGCFLSFIGNNLPTGPFMVIGASIVFFGAFVFGPRHGLLPRWWQHASNSLRTRRENTLRELYRLLEDGGFDSETIPLKDLAHSRHETFEEAAAQANDLRGAGWATFDDKERVITLTPAGWERACQVTRNHRLWELYLTQEADFEADHVHEDAHIMEHVLSEELVRRLERQLAHPNTDPHGKPIPSQQDMAALGVLFSTPDPPPGYGTGALHR